VVGYARLTPISRWRRSEIPAELFTLYFYYIEPTLTGGTGATKKSKAVTVEDVSHHASGEDEEMDAIVPGVLRFAYRRGAMMARGVDAKLVETLLGIASGAPLPYTEVGSKESRRAVSSVG
jgi:hypothetical protein